MGENQLFFVGYHSFMSLRREELYIHEADMYKQDLEEIGELVHEEQSY